MSKRIRVTYSSIDGFRQTRTFKTIEGAGKFARTKLGPPDIGSHYAMSYDGVGKITVSGCTLDELFGAVKPSKPACICDPDWCEPGWGIVGTDPVIVNGELIDFVERFGRCPVCNPEPPPPAPSCPWLDPAEIPF